jgi:Bacterial regulatory helix-turn-helix protein, lysR family
MLIFFGFDAYKASFMNLSWLDDFLTLAAIGNFSRAAAERHMTQPAFSRRIMGSDELIPSPRRTRTDNRSVGFAMQAKALHYSCWITAMNLASEGSCGRCTARR